MLALLFSLASWPMAGLLVGVLVFLIPVLACDHSAPKASELPAGFEALEDDVEAGLSAAILDPVAEPVLDCCNEACTDWK